MNSRHFFHPARAAGIYIDRHGLTAVQCDCRDGGRLQWRHSVTTGHPISDKSVPEQDTLESFFSGLKQHIGHEYIPASIALADPWVRQAMLVSEQLPRSEQERRALIEWRLARDWQVEPGDLFISWQYLGQQDGRHHVLAQSTARQLLGPILQQTSSNRIMLLNVDAIGNYLYNGLEEQSNALLLHIQPEYWSVYITDANGWPLYRRSKWQAAPDSQQAIDVFVAQIERMIVSVTQEVIGHISVIAGELPVDEILHGIERRFERTPRYLPGKLCQATGGLSSGEILAMQTLEAA